MTIGNDSGQKSSWYREPWMWFVVGLPAFWVCLSIYGVYLTVKHQDDLVRDDWYKAGRSINEDLRAEERARVIGLNATLAFDGATRQVRIVLNTAVPAEHLKLDLVHSTLAREDITVQLSPAADGGFTAVLPRLPAGKRNLMLVPVGEGIDADSRWRLRANEITFQGHDIALSPNG